MRMRTLPLAVLLLGLSRLAAAAPKDPPVKPAKPVKLEQKAPTPPSGVAVTPPPVVSPPSTKEQDAERVKLDALAQDCDLIAALDGRDADALRAEVDQVRAGIATPKPAVATSNLPTLASVSAQVQLSLTVNAKAFAAHTANLRDTLKDQTKKIADKKEQLEWNDRKTGEWTARVVELEGRIDALDQLVEDAVSSASADRAKTVAVLRKSADDGVAKLVSELAAQPGPAPAALVAQVEGAAGLGLPGGPVGLGYQAGASFGFESRHCCGLGVFILDGGASKSKGTLGGGIEVRANVWRHVWLFGRAGRASTQPNSKGEHQTGYEFGGGAFLRAIGRSPAANAFTPLVDITVSYSGWALGQMLNSGDPQGSSQYTSAIVAGVRIGADYGLDLN